ncbi:unnamed protein product [Brassica oleracea var. botrytis]
METLLALSSSIFQISLSFGISSSVASLKGGDSPLFFPTFISAMPASSSFILARSSLGV